MKGSISHLGKWIAWERTDDERGAEMAMAFRNAIGLSYKECCEMCITLEEIAGIIRQELENMPINVNCGGGCGGCSGCGNGCMPLPTEDNVPPGQNPPEPTEDNPGDDIELCNKAHDVCARYIEFWNQVSVYSTGITTDVLAGILDGLLIFYGIGGPFASLLTLFSQYVVSTLASSAKAMFESLCPAIISAIRTSPSASIAKSAVQNLVWSASYPYHIRLAGYYLVSLANWDMVYTPGSWTPPSYPDCEDVPEPGVCWLPAGYQTQRAVTIVEHESSPYTVTVTLTANAGSDTCGSFSSAQYTAALTAQNQTFDPIFKTLYETETVEAVGYVIETFFNEAFGGNSPSTPVVRVGFDLDSEPLAEGS